MPRTRRSHDDSHARRPKRAFLYPPDSCGATGRRPDLGRIASYHLPAGRDGEIRCPARRCGGNGPFGHAQRTRNLRRRARCSREQRYIFEQHCSRVTCWSATPWPPSWAGAGAQVPLAAEVGADPPLSNKGQGLGGAHGWSAESLQVVQPPSDPNGEVHPPRTHEPTHGRRRAISLLDLRRAAGPVTPPSSHARGTEAPVPAPRDLPRCCHHRRRTCQARSPPGPQARLRSTWL